MKHYQLGEFVTGENTSFAGLIGGMQQNQKRWFVSWGKIPLNDRRLVILDEASGLSKRDISNMSGVRSSGIAGNHQDSPGKDPCTHPFDLDFKYPDRQPITAV